jgi:hypothetical protein
LVDVAVELIGIGRGARARHAPQVHPVAIRTIGNALLVAVLVAGLDVAPTVQDRLPTANPTSTLRPSPSSDTPVWARAFRPLNFLSITIVDHAGDGVGPVDGRDAARDGVDALDQHLRDHVDVDDAVQQRRRNAQAVQQDQGAVRTDVAQIELVGRGVAGPDTAGGRRIDARAARAGEHRQDGEGVGQRPRLNTQRVLRWTPR